MSLPDAFAGQDKPEGIYAKAGLTPRDCRRGVRGSRQVGAGAPRAALMREPSRGRMDDCEQRGVYHSVRVASGSSATLVTGASGFVGSAIAAALRRNGRHKVVAFVRSSSSRVNLDPRDAVVEGDLTDRASLAAALRGVRFLFHAAADYRLWARRPDEITRNNVEGTRLIMEEALRAGVERIVYTSSVATLKLTEGALAGRIIGWRRTRRSALTNGARSPLNASSRR